ncbi:MAG TPA: DUF6463 family protein [Herpetosiphonaceae bacterium]|nr:DUF6463 family protein [Herpetosiphonaceae bacterium]
MALRKHVGTMLLATGMLHTAVGLWHYRQPLLAILGAGRWMSVTGDSGREAAFWFILFGVVLMMFGQFVRWALRHAGTLPASLGWSLLALGLLGVAFMPDSGFWLVLPQAWLALAIARGPGFRSQDSEVRI